MPALPLLSDEPCLDQDLQMERQGCIGDFCGVDKGGGRGAGWTDGNKVPEERKPSGLGEGCKRLSGRLDVHISKYIEILIRVGAECKDRPRSSKTGSFANKSCTEDFMGVIFD